MAQPAAHVSDPGEGEIDDPTPTVVEILEEVGSTVCASTGTATVTWLDESSNVFVTSCRVLDYDGFLLVFGGDYEVDENRAVRRVAQGPVESSG